MPYQLVHDGVVREFEFYAPYGWPYWLERASTEDGRSGLPLVVALHGGGQSPANFAVDWPFPLLFNDADNANWEDRAFVLYPYGFSYVPGLDGEPDRGWDTGFTGTYLPVQNDVGFIKAMIAAVERLLEKELDQLGVRRRPIDADRRFLFGYSMGGMMAYRLVKEMPDHWGALWVMAAAFGGRSHAELTPTVTHPPQGRSSVSLFAHHGDLDILVPPGPHNDPSGLALSEFIRDVHIATGLTNVDAERYASSLRHLAAAVLTYRTYNNCRSTAYSVNEPPLNGLADVGGTNLSVQYTYRQDGSPANPEVTVYRDPLMEHANFIANRYFQVADVWQFFKDHPRVDL
jgi:poly(3-hydroxybutyrate) depolymerase